jgi:hypothetical protein
MVRCTSVLGLGLASSIVVACVYALGQTSPIVYRFRLEAAFTFDGKPYTALGSMECEYRRGSAVNRSERHRLGPPLLEGYYTSRQGDSPSVVLAGGDDTILFMTGGSCPSLSNLRKTILADPSALNSTPQLAYYFPNRSNPPVIWVLRDRRATHKDSGRFVFDQYRD